jgi:hypothetical protein
VASPGVASGPQLRDAVTTSRAVTQYGGRFGGVGPSLQDVSAQVATGLVDVLVHGVPGPFGVAGPDGVEHGAMVLDRVSADVLDLGGLASGRDQEPAQLLQQGRDERVAGRIEHDLVKCQVRGDEGIDVALASGGHHPMIT